MEHKPQSRPDVQHLIVQRHTASHEYDPEKALALYHALQPWLTDNDSGWNPYSHFHDAEHYTDEDRIVVLFEMLDQSLFGDVIFGSLADDDVAHELKTRGWGPASEPECIHDTPQGGSPYCYACNAINKKALAATRGIGQ